MNDHWGDRCRSCTGRSCTTCTSFLLTLTSKLIRIMIPRERKKKEWFFSHSSVGNINNLSFMSPSLCDNVCVQAILSGKGDQHQCNEKIFSVLSFVVAFFLPYLVNLDRKFHFICLNVAIVCVCSMCTFHHRKVHIRANSFGTAHLLFVGWHSMLLA